MRAQYLRVDLIDLREDGVRMIFFVAFALHARGTVIHLLERDSMLPHRT